MLAGASSLSRGVAAAGSAAVGSAAASGGAWGVSSGAVAGAATGGGALASPRTETSRAVTDHLPTEQPEPDGSGAGQRNLPRVASARGAGDCSDRRSETPCGFRWTQVPTPRWPASRRRWQVVAAAPSSAPYPPRGARERSQLTAAVGRWAKLRRVRGADCAAQSWAMPAALPTRAFQARAASGAPAR